MNQKQKPKVIAIVGTLLTIIIASASIYAMYKITMDNRAERIQMKERFDRMHGELDAIEKMQDEAFEILDEIKGTQDEIKDTQDEIIEKQSVKQKKEQEVIASFASVNYEEQAVPSSYEREVIFTNFYVGDATGSGTVTASGLTTSDFTVDAKGFYRYQGQVVIATANTTRLPRDLYAGYGTHELYESLQIVIDGERHGAIVLDVCGACYGMPSENYQRYDVMTTSDTLGKVKGSVIY